MHEDDPASFNQNQGQNQPYPMEYALAQPTASLLGVLVNGYFQYQNLAQRQREAAETATQRDRHHAEALASQERLQRQAQDFQKQQADQAHNRRIDEAHWPLTLSPDTFAHHAAAHDRQPLTVLLSPPPESDPQFREVVKDIENELRAVLQKDFALNDPDRPVHFLAKAWESGSVGGEAPAKALFHELSGVPTLIIDLEMIERDVYIHTHVWGIGPADGKPFLDHVSLHEHPLPLSHYLAEVARRKAREWGEISQMLGKDATPHKHDKDNWDILQRENLLREKDPQRGATFFVRHYAYTTEYLREAARNLTPALQLLVAGVADLYHLLRHGVSPRLPTLLGKLFGNTQDPRVSEMMKQVLDGYVKTMELIAKDKPEFAPMFYLELAEGLARLRNTGFCEIYLILSLLSWRKLRNGEMVEGGILALLEGMQDILEPEDNKYFIRVANLLNNPLNIAVAANQAMSLSKNSFKPSKIRFIEKIGKPSIRTPDLVDIPVGSFMMGISQGELDTDKRELPQHQVTFIKPFKLARFPVTFEEFNIYCEQEGLSKPYGKPYDGGEWCNDRPVINVSWDTVQNYIKWLNKKTGKNFRLPTEAEWEYACRAGTQTFFSYGNSMSIDQANFLNDRSCSYNCGNIGIYLGNTQPVKMYEPNQWGLYQMHGNIWEWCQDLWHKNYKNAPQDGSAWQDQGWFGAESRRVIRGGAWNTSLFALRSGFRAYQEESIEDNALGFRLAHD
ncbi:MAG: SUMF1/EgtB/PvdO family nonheme iron enzyme [Candidatus Methylumidiphilus sp.]